MERINTNFSAAIGNHTYYFTFLNNLGYTKSWTACRHNHSEIEVQFILSGKCSILLGDILTEVEAGNILVIAPQVYHAPSLPGPSGNFEKYSFLFSFSKNRNNRDVSNMQGAQTFASAFQSIEKFRIFKDLFNGASELEKVIDEFRKKQSGYMIRIISIMTGLIVSLSRCVTNDGCTKDSIACKTPDENRIVIIESFFDYDYNFKRSKKDLANELGVSCRHVDRILKKTYNKSFRDKLQQSRMEVAADLLANSSRHIGSIANQLGYNSEAGFYRMFYNYYKSTPASFRKRMCMKKTVLLGH